MSLQLASLSASIAVGHLQTPLDERATVVAPSTPWRAAKRLLDECQFDQAPVVEDGVPRGYVLTRDLPLARGAVISVMKPILPRALVSHTTPLVDTLPWLETTRFLFLLEGQRVSGFIVPSDLNRQAGRSYFYLGIVELELRLAELVRSIGRTTDVLAAVSAPEAKKLLKRLEASKLSNTEVDIVAEMYLPHLFTIAGRLSDLPVKVGVAIEDWPEFWRSIKDLRNRVSHAAGTILKAPQDLEDILEADRRVHRVIAALDGAATSAGERS